MVSYKSFFLIKGLSIWNSLSSGVQSFTSGMISFYHTICDWFHPESTTWYLYSNSLFPISFYYRYGHTMPEWTYRPDTNELIYHGDKERDKERDKEQDKDKSCYYRISWLSARITSGSTTKDMDSFLNHLRIHSEKMISLPSIIFLQAWSLYDKRWWYAEESSRLEWIDAFAEESSASCTEDLMVPITLCRPLKKN